MFPRQILSGEFFYIFFIYSALCIDIIPYTGILYLHTRIGYFKYNIRRDTALEENTTVNCCRSTGKSKYRDRNSKEYKSLITRLNRIEGQIRGIRNMVESDRYCVDILTQVTAVQSALNSFNKLLLSQHIKSCVVHDIREGKDEVVDELVCTLQKLMK